MTVKLVSHINRDDDLIESWLRYYCKLGIDSFHFVVHGGREENRALFAIQDYYPIVIEDCYEGSFHIDEKKSRLDGVIARHAGEWLCLADSDEFVELPYEDVAATIQALNSAGSNLMAAPMLQRLTGDGTLDTPSAIDDPFLTFPLCSADLYRRMGVKGDIFKFPLFFCGAGTKLAEGGNHHPPMGQEPRLSTIRGVTHHFKFRRAVSERLENRINSAHPWRHESAQFRAYLESHSNRLPLEGTFTYSREELFRRGLLKQLRAVRQDPHSSGQEGLQDTGDRLISPDKSIEPSRREPRETTGAKELADSRARKIMFVLPKAAEFGGLERHLLELLPSLVESRCNVLIVCCGLDLISARVDPAHWNRVRVECGTEPSSLIAWLQLIRKARPDTLIFCYNWIEAFSWHGPTAGLLACVRKRFAIQHLIPPPFPPSAPGLSPQNLLRRLIGKRARRLIQIRASSYLFTKTICVSKAVRDALVKSYGFRKRRTITIANGVSSALFTASTMHGEGVRAELEIEPCDFVLVCAARLVEAKGIDILLHAVSRVLRQALPVKCIIVGDGPLKENLVRQVNTLGISDYVHFVGFQKDVRPYLQAASSFILTSHLEGLPLAILEAMASELPCIVTDVGGNAEAVEQGVTGVVIQPNSIDETENAILFLATHPQERAQMARQARLRVCRDFNLETSVGRLTRLVLA